VTSDIEIVVAEDPARNVAERLAAAARQGGHLVLTGGSTPRIAYELAAALESDWAAVELWWGDERCVAPGDERSNYGMAKKALLDRVTV
jgi:6-phosphogluconolactonase